MLVKAQKRGGKWELVALTGELYGKVLGTVEGFRLGSPRLRAHYVTGILKRYYGAELTFPALDDNEILSKAVPQGEFEKLHHSLEYDHITDSWFDPATGEDVGGIAILMLKGNVMTYSTQEDIKADRRNLTNQVAAEDKPNPSLIDKIMRVAERRYNKRC